MSTFGSGGANQGDGTQTSGGSQYQRHPDLFIEPRHAVFLVENITFAFDISILLHLSEPLRGLLTIPTSESSEGTERNPIRVEGITNERFANFFRWLKHIDWQPSGSLERDSLVDILHMSHMWDIRTGFHYAVHELGKKTSGELSATFKLDLARKYGISEWIRPATLGLLATELTTITLLDIEQMSIPIYIIIAKAREVIEKERKLVALVAPQLPTNSSNLPLSWCSDHGQCRKVWSDVWWNVVAKKLLQPTNNLLPSNILSYLRTIEHPGMKADCKDDMLEWLTTHDNGLGIVNQVEDSAVNAVLRECGLS